MTRAPRPGVPAMTPEARLSPPASWASAKVEWGAQRQGFGKRQNGPPRHAWEWPRE